MALVCGNTYVIKPSEQDPGSTLLLMEMAKEAGVPDGVVNVIHGQKEGKPQIFSSESILTTMTCIFETTVER